MESPTARPTQDLGRSSLRMAGIVTAIALVTLGGFLAFRFTVMEIVMATRPLTLLLFAVVAGIATFFNPCSFPLLPGYLTYYSSTEKVGSGRTLYNALVASLGLILFILILGAIIGILGDTFGRSLSVAGGQPNEYVLLFRGAVGPALIALGLSHFFGRGINFHFLSRLGHKFASTQGIGTAKGLFTYGFGYNVIGIGCGGPILAGLTVFAFSAGGFSAAFLAFGVYAATMAVLMVFVSLLASSAKGTVIKSMRRSTARVQKITAITQAAVGVLLILSTVYVDVFVELLFP